MLRCRPVRIALYAIAAAALLSPRAFAYDTLRIGLVLPLTGSQAAIGKQIDNAMRLYLEQNGDTIEGTRIEVFIRDDESNPDNTKIDVRDLIENEKVNILAGFGTSPAAVVAAPLATQAKIPQVVMGAQTSLVTQRSPFMVRSGATVAQSASTLALWAARHNIRKVVALTTDYAPGVDALQEFKRAFVAEGGDLVNELRIPLFNADLNPPLTQIKEAKPDAVFVFVPAQQAHEVMEAIASHGIVEAGTKVIGLGDLTDDDLLKDMSPAALGTITAHYYSAAHPTHVNHAFVEAYQQAYSERPGFMAVAGYDGTHIICEALRLTHGKVAGEGLLRAMKGLSFESPRGPMSIDPETREPVHNIYIRKVETDNGENANIEFETFEAVKDPGKTPRP
jgi:branched-chain amino acid transport system substrate-binding protein